LFFSNHNDDRLSRRRSRAFNQNSRLCRLDSLSQDAEHGNEGGRTSAITWTTANCGCKTSRRHARLAEPRQPWKPARRNRKSLLHAGVLARTMSAPRLLGTNGLAASTSVTGSSTPYTRRGRNSATRSDTGIKTVGRCWPSRLDTNYLMPPKPCAQSDGHFSASTHITFRARNWPRKSCRESCAAG